MSRFQFTWAIERLAYEDGAVRGNPPSAWVPVPGARVKAPDMASARVKLAEWVGEDREKRSYRSDSKGAYRLVRTDTVVVVPFTASFTPGRQVIKLGVAS